MTGHDALIEILERVGANGNEAVLLGAEELGQWPARAVAVMKERRLLARAGPAQSALCPGCEQQCVMPVKLWPGQPKSPNAFVICDKRGDINRVTVSIDALEQWQASGETVAKMLAQLLGLKRSVTAEPDATRWEIGMYKGVRHASHLVLLSEGGLKLSLAGHSLVLDDVLTFLSDRIAVNRRLLTRCVDNPAAGAGDIESGSQRRIRLSARVEEEKANGTKAFLKVVAGEEGISTSRLKQILRKPSSLTE